MKPIKLEIEGINSFTDRQELDFETVGRNNLFCISGKTGAGKTTIFDCLILALYGKSGKGNLADVVNLTRDRAFVALEFESGVDIYRVERTIKCSKERADGKEQSDPNQKTALKQRTATSECRLIKNGEPLTVTRGGADEILEGIVGLSDDEFKNVYLLEQGKYADFLKKTPAKQLETVGKIFSLMRFADVFKLANDHRAEEQNSIEGHDRLIEAIGEDAPAVLRATTAELKALRAKNAALVRDIENGRAKLDELSKVRDAYITAAEKAAAVKRLAVDLDDKKRKAAASEAAYNEFIASIDDGGARETELKELRETLSALRELGVLDKQYATLCADYTTKRTALDNVIEAAASAERKAEECSARAENEYSQFATVVADMKNGVPSAGRSDAVARLFAINTDDRAGAVNGVRELISALNFERDRFAEIESRRKALSDKCERLKTRKDGLIEKIRILTDDEKAAEREKEAATEKASAAERALIVAQTHSHAAAVRAELKDGDVCPVCGGAYHIGGGAIGANVEECKAAVEAAKKELTEAQTKAVAAAKRLGETKVDFDRTDGELNEATAELNAIDEQIKSSGYSAELNATLIQKAKSADTYGSGYLQAESEKQRNAPNLARLVAERDSTRAAIEEIAKKQEDIKARLGDNLGKTEEKINEAREKTEALEREIAERDGKRQSLAAARDGDRAAVAAIAQMLETAQKECPVDMPEFDEEDYNNKKQMFESKQSEHNEREKEIAVKDDQVKKLAEACEKLKKIEGERSACVKREKIFAEIAELTKGKALLNFVANEYIAEFAAVASEILGTLSSGKYSINYDEDNGFTVTDYLNGGKARKTGTLSGGELFLASLSVAIAIARTQSKGNNAFFFLDEGFGTLDEELIDIVFGALESLSHDCLVGVISHSSALIERMPDCVIVEEASGSIGSRISYK